MAVFNPYPGLGEEERRELWAQQIAGNVLLYEIFMRLYLCKKPIRIDLLTTMIWREHTLRFKRSTVRHRIMDLCYYDHLIQKFKRGKFSYVQLNAEGLRLVAIMMKLMKISKMSLSHPLVL